MLETVRGNRSNFRQAKGERGTKHEGRGGRGREEAREKEKKREKKKGYFFEFTHSFLRSQ